jgi:murein hydrolase activator
MTVLRAVLWTLCLMASVSHATQQEQLDNLRKRIASLQHEVEKTSESKAEVVDALRESERAVSDSNRALSALATEQGAAQQTLTHLQKQSQQLETDMQDQQAQLRALLYQQYLGGKQEYLKLMLNNHDPSQVARELQYYEYIARGRTQWLKTLRGNLTQLAQVTTEAKQKSGELATLQHEQSTQKKKLEQDKQARQKMLLKVALQLKQQRQEIGRLQRDENRLAELVEKLSKMLAQGAQSNEALPDNRFDGKPFDALKGKLALPVKGTIRNKFGTPRPDSSVLWKGLFVRAAANQPVKAVAAGRVVFADWLRGFGNLLIVDHGKGYMSLYGNNETLFKQVGDVLRGGDTVAAVGNSGGNEDSGLYFELRYEGRALDPSKWLASK